MADTAREEALTEDVVYSIATLPNFAQDGVCFVGRRSGLYRSDDRGNTWRFAYDSLDLEEPLATTGVVVSPGFESDQSVFAGVPGGVLRSTDGGETWNAAVFRSPPPFVSTLAISPNFVRDGVLFAGTMEDGVFRSGDRGGRWSAWNFGLLDLGVLCIDISADFADDETLFVGTETGVFRSRNGGRAWREVGFPTELAPILSLKLSPRYTQDGTLFAGTEPHGLLRSEDEGQTWERLGEDIITESVNGVQLSPDFPARPHVLAALGTAILISRDGGRTWSRWRTHQALGQGIASVAAPSGLAPDAPLLVGLVGGDVLRL